MDDKFEIPEDILETAFETLPPESVVSAVNPSSTGMRRIIEGIALNGITLNFLALNYILPAIGSILLVMGFRNLKRENAWFRTAYILSIVRFVVLVPQLMVNATIYAEYLQGDVGRIVLIGSCAIQAAMLFSFWMAIDKVQEKAGIEKKSFCAGALFLWYLLIFLAVAIGFKGTITAIVMIAVFIMIIKSLITLSRLMKTNGYLVKASPVRISDNVLMTILACIIVVGIASGYAFFSSYDMKWEPVVYSKNATFDHLLALGYPKEQLKDLSLQDLELLKDADCLVTHLDERSLSSVIEQTDYYRGGTIVDIEYPDKELKFIHVAVRVARDDTNGERWRVIHHFELDDKLNVNGTENLMIWTLGSLKGWTGTQNPSGRLLCKQKGVDLTAEYAFMGEQIYTTTNVFGQQINDAYMCDFSIPQNALNRRGYVAYTSEQIENGYPINAWIGYTHQAGCFQYPVKTAHSHIQNGMAIWEYPFITAQSSLRVHFVDGKPEIENTQDL